MKFGEHELKCCGGDDIEHRLDYSPETATSPADWMSSFVCQNCKRSKARILSGAPDVLFLADSKRFLDPDDATMWAGERRDSLSMLTEGARIQVMRQGPQVNITSFARLYKTTRISAIEVVRIAGILIAKEDEQRSGLSLVELESWRRQRAIRFYESIIEDESIWRTNLKCVMNARRELSALEGLAGDTGQINLNIEDKRGQITVYQLNVPDNGRARLPEAEQPLVIEIKDVECLPLQSQK